MGDSVTNDTLEVLLDDGCCRKQFIKASRLGKLAGEEWTCPKCGIVWRGRMESQASVRRWTPVPAIAILRLRE